MIAVLASGTLFRDPKPCVAKSGKPFVTATLKVSDQQGRAEFIRIMTWSDHTRAALDELQGGAALTVTGRLEVEIFTPANGEPRPSLTIFADQVIALKKQVRKREAADPPIDKQRAGRAAVNDVPDDEIPF